MHLPHLRIPGKKPVLLVFCAFNDSGVAPLKTGKNQKLITTPADIRLSLNPMEKEVLALLVQGLTSRQIAEKLFISKSTVDTHRQNIRAKTGAKTTAELIALALK